MNYTSDVTIIISLNAQMNRLTKEIIDVFSRASVRGTRGRTMVLRFEWLKPEDNEKLTRWLDTFNADDDEIYEVLALGPDFDELEHYSNGGWDWLYVERQVFFDQEEVTYDSISYEEAMTNDLQG